MSYDSYRYMEDGAAVSGTRWADDEELKQRLTPIDLSAKHYSTSGLPLICDRKTAYVSGDDSHGLIMGSTGSKKSRLIAMPLMELFARAGESVICTDPKGELYMRTSGLYKQEGYDIKVLNLRKPHLSHGWNPLREAELMNEAGGQDEAIGIINDLGAAFFPLKSSKTDPFWAQTSRTLFEALCEMVLTRPGAYPELSLRTVQQLTEGLSDDEIVDTLGIIKRYAPSSLARINLNSALSGSDKTTDNIIVSYKAGMQFLYSRESLLDMLSVNDINFALIGERKTALYIIMPDEKTTLHPLVSLFIKQCYERLIYTAQSYADNSLPIRVNFLLDEFSNLPPIPDMSSMISAARSRNIRFYLILQSLNQLKSKYGEDADTIRGNCNDWVFLTSREVELLTELQTLCGTVDDAGHPLISISQLQRLDKSEGEALILSGRLYPYIAHLCDIDSYPYSHIEPCELPKLKYKKLDYEAFGLTESRLMDYETFVDSFSVSSMDALERLLSAREGELKLNKVRMGRLNGEDVYWRAHRVDSNTIKLFCEMLFHIPPEYIDSLLEGHWSKWHLEATCRIALSESEKQTLLAGTVLKDAQNYLTPIYMPTEEDFRSVLDRLEGDKTFPALTCFKGKMDESGVYLLSSGAFVKNGEMRPKGCGLPSGTCVRPCVYIMRKGTGSLPRVAINLAPIKRGQDKLYETLNEEMLKYGDDFSLDTKDYYDDEDITDPFDKPYDDLFDEDNTENDDQADE